ncbi:TonB-dependent siderophore receptor [Thermithiobacillus plumbiphilus]|uniref:TonB-dependent siderophore receptor n=1 Tax=Thermithiobacillus plumbiphilus TaxID=1729899 RepID=A0ABU9D938_9PROT
MRVFSKPATRVATPLALAISAALGAMPVYGQEGSKTDDKKVQTSQAQNTTKAEGSTRLQAVTVSSDWLGVPTEKSVKTYPGARDVVTETELHQSGSRTVEDALRLVPGVRTSDETGVGTLPNIGIRGLNPMRTEQTMILVDGIPVTLAPYGQTGMSLFPLTMETVDRIDVARGGVAVHYGPNNVGGVVNFITRPIPQKMTIGARENLTISENGHVLTDTFARVGGFVSDRFGIQLMANRIDGQSYREHSDTKVNNLMLDADWFPSDSTEIKGRLQYYDADTELPGALTPEAYEQDREQSTRPYDFFKGDTVRGSLVFNKTFANQSEFSWTNFGHRSERIFGFASVPAGGMASTPANAVLTSPRNYWVFGTEPRYTFNLNAGAKQKIMLGARYMREEVDYVVDRRDLSSGAYTVPQDRRFENNAYAAFASDTFSLLNDRLKVTPGVRYESVNLYFRNNNNGAENRNPTRDWLPGLDIGYQASDKLFVFANYHESLRPVQFVHIALGGDFVSERANNYEAGLRLTPVRGLDTTLTYFRFDFDNKIELNAGSFRNLGKARHQGVETELNWSPAALAGLDLQASYTYLDTEQLSAGENKGKDLPFASRHQFTTMANYRAGTFNWNVNGSYFSSAFTDAANTETENDSGSAGEIPAYWLWNAQVSKDFRLNNTPMQIGLGVNNIFDEDYYFRGVDYSFGRMPGLGRSYLLKLGVNI